MGERVLLCFGDSNTHGTLAMRDMDDRRRLERGARWPGVAAAALGAGWHVIEEGHPGRNAAMDDPVEGAHKNGLRALPVVLESHRPVDVVAVMIGTNDLKARFALPAGDIALAVDRLAGAVAGSECGPGTGAPALLLIAPAPIEETGWMGEMFAGGAARSRRLAGHLAKIARRRGAAFLDAGRHATVDPLDGIHLDAAGHAALGAAVAAKVVAMAGA